MKSGCWMKKTDLLYAAASDCRELLNVLNVLNSFVQDCLWKEENGICMCQ